MILMLTAISSVEGFGTSSISNPGPHGFTQILYAFMSQAGNNGSAFGGLNGNTLWYNTAGGDHHAAGTIFHDHAHAGDCRQLGQEEIRSAVAGNIPRDHAVVQRVAGGSDFDRRRTDLFPRTEPGADPRAPDDDRGQDFLRT